MSTFIHEMFSGVQQFCFSFIIFKKLYFIECKKKNKKKQSRDGIINLPPADLFSKHWHQHQPQKPYINRPTGLKCSTLDFFEKCQTRW